MKRGSINTPGSTHKQGALSRKLVLQGRDGSEEEAAGEKGRGGWGAGGWVGRRGSHKSRAGWGSR